jgi:uncharacterized OB-fold protein
MVRPLYCPKCAAQVHPDWPYCTHCGSRLDLEQNFGSKKANCASCGAAVSSSSAICPQCGSQLGTGDESLLPPRGVVSRGVTESRPPPPSSDSAHPGAAPDTSEDEIPICENCGAAVDTTGAYCWKCGVPLETGRDPFIPAPPAAPDRVGPREDSLGVYTQSSPARPRERSGQSRRRPPLTRRDVSRSAFLIVASALLLVSLFAGWYVVSATASYSYEEGPVTLNATSTQYPFNHYSETITCEGSANCFGNQTYTGTNSGSLATLYDLAAGLVVGAVITGVTGVIVSFAGGRNRARLTGNLALAALILSLMAPAIMFAAQPYVLNTQGAPGGSAQNQSAGPSPRTSYFGTCSGSGCGSALTPGETLNANWGPGLGWYLPIAAAAPLLLGRAFASGPKRAPFERTLYGPQ